MAGSPPASSLWTRVFVGCGDLEAQYRLGVYIGGMFTDIWC